MWNSVLRHFRSFWSLGLSFRSSSSTEAQGQLLRQLRRRGIGYGYYPRRRIVPELVFGKLPLSGRPVLAAVIFELPIPLLRRMCQIDTLHCPIHPLLSMTIQTSFLYDHTVVKCSYPMSLSSNVHSLCTCHVSSESSLHYELNDNNCFESRGFHLK